MSDDHQVSPLDSAGALAALSSIVLSDNSLNGVLTRTCQVMKRTIPGAAEVSVTMLGRDRPSTVAFSGQLALDLDEAQYDEGYGPCLDAARSGETIVVTDAASDDRWPDYLPRAVEAGALSSLSVPLRVEGRPIGAVNTYGLDREAFDSGAVDLAQTVSEYASIVLHNADLYFTATSVAEQMRQAMTSRSVIEQAKGILMAERHCSADEAFDLLVRLSQESHRKLREVAEALVDHATKAG